MKFDRIVVSGLRNLLHKCILGSSTLTTYVRRGCLRISMVCLWYCAKAYQQLDASEPSSAYSFSILDIVSPEFIHLFQTEQDSDSRMMGRCVGALAVVKLMPDVRSRSDSNSQIDNDVLMCLSTILGIGRDDVKYCLEWPDAVVLATIASLALGDFGSFGPFGLDWEVKTVAKGTLDIIFQVLPAENAVGLQPFTWGDIFNGKITRIFASSLHHFLQVDDSGAEALTANVRRSCLHMYLRSLWYCAKAYHQPGISQPLPSYFPSTLASPEIIRLIHVEQDPISRATGRCFGALVVMKLAADIRSRVVGLDFQIGDEELACLSAILGAEGPNLKIWFGQPCAIELANIISLISTEIDLLFSDLFSDTAPSEPEVLDMMQQTYTILTRTLPATLNAKLTDFIDGESEVKLITRFFDLRTCLSETSPPTKSIHETQLRMCLESLWHCARAYDQLQIAVPLPSFFRITLTNPEFTRRIYAEGDITTRITGRCLHALIINRLLGDFQSDIHHGNYDLTLDLPSLVGINLEPGESTRWSRPSAVLRLRNVISLMSDEIEVLLTSGTPSVLQIVQETLDIICPDLVRGVFSGEDLPVDEVLPLRDICSRIANTRPTNRFRDEVVGILAQLEQILKQLPTMERKMRRCTSSTFVPQLVRGRSNFTTRPESGKRSKSI